MENYEKSFFFNASPEIFKRARELRKNLTGSEKVLWDELKENKLERWHFRRQHPISKFSVDFYCHEHTLIIEIDEGIHLKEEIAEHDEGREYELRRLGLKILRFKNEKILSNIDSVLSRIKAYINKIQ